MWGNREILGNKEISGMWGNREILGNKEISGMWGNREMWEIRVIMLKPILCTFFKLFSK